MKNTARFGNAAEVELAKALEMGGWVVGSRRHIGGGGDLLAVRMLDGVLRDGWDDKPHKLHKVLLIEVKATAEVPWRSTFGPVRRRELLEAAQRINADPWLAWKHDGEWDWRSPDSWPRT